MKITFLMALGMKLSAFVLWLLTTPQGHAVAYLMWGGLAGAMVGFNLIRRRRSSAAA